MMWRTYHLREEGVAVMVQHRHAAEMQERMRDQTGFARGGNARLLLLPIFLQEGMWPSCCCCRLMKSEARGRWRGRARQAAGAGGAGRAPSP